MSAGIGPVAAVLSERSHKAAAFLDEAGWTQGTEKDAQGRVCATGAVMYCQPRNGDEYLVREVLRRRDTAEAWNDAEGRTAAEVREALDKDITDEELAVTFGPQWVEVVALVRRSASLTPEEAAKLAAAWGAAWGAVWGAAWGAAWDAARAAARAAAWDAARAAARAAAWDAALALVIRDRIGHDDFTQEHYDILTGPWRRVIGKIHADDADLLGQVSL